MPRYAIVAFAMAAAMLVALLLYVPFWESSKRDVVAPQRHVVPEESLPVHDLLGGHREPVAAEPATWDPKETWEVLDMSGGAIEGASLVFRSHHDGPPTPAPSLASGRFLEPSDSGGPWLLASAAAVGYLTQALTLEECGDSKVIRLPRNDVISGRALFSGTDIRPQHGLVVAWEQGSPPPKAESVFGEDPVGSAFWTANIDRNGEFRIGGLIAGRRYCLLAGGEGAFTEAPVVGVLPNEAAPIEFSLKSLYAVHLQLEGTSGQVVKAAPTYDTRNPGHISLDSANAQAYCTRPTLGIILACDGYYHLIDRAEFLRSWFFISDERVESLGPVVISERCMGIGEITLSTNAIAAPNFQVVTHNIDQGDEIETGVLEVTVGGIHVDVARTQRSGVAWARLVLIDREGVPWGIVLPQPRAAVRFEGIPTGDYECSLVVVSTGERIRPVGMASTFELTKDGGQLHFEFPSGRTVKVEVTLDGEDYQGPASILVVADDGRGSRAEVSPFFFRCAPYVVGGLPLDQLTITLTQPAYGRVTLDGGEDRELREVSFDVASRE